MRWLLIFLPLGLLLAWRQVPGIWVFLTAALALIPLADALTQSTDRVAARLGERWGALISVSLSNAPELIFGGVALAAGEVELVKISLIGSILSNLLLVLGLAMLFGGLRNLALSFSPRAARLTVSLLILSLIVIVLPSFLGRQIEAYTVGAAFVLLLTYGATLLFSLYTHRGWLGGRTLVAASGGVLRELLVLIAVSFGIALASHLLVSSLPALSARGVPPLFVGGVLIPFLANAAEHVSAIRFALEDRMDLAVELSAGSSLQIALFTLPLLLLLGGLLGHPWLLSFNKTWWLAALGAAILIAAEVLRDGETHWLEGVLLLGIYALIAWGLWLY
jgi:Ca2+:H+ antiporter